MRPQGEDTLPRLLLLSCEKYGNKQVAMRKKMLGIWREHTWADTLLQVKRLSLGLRSLGLGAGDTAVIMADSEPQWVWAALAIIAAGGTTVAIPPHVPPDELKQALARSKPKLAIVADQEGVDVLLEARAGLDVPRNVVAWGYEGLSAYDNDTIISMAKVMELGETHDRSHPGLFDEGIARGLGTDLAFVFLAGGNGGTGLEEIPYTQRSFVESARKLVSMAPCSQRDDYVSCSSPANFQEALLVIGAHLVTGMKINFPETADTVIEDTREISPTHVCCDASQWQTIVSQVQSRIDGSAPMNRALYRSFLQLSRKAHPSQKNGALSFLSTLLYRALYAPAVVLFLRPLRDKFGYSRTKYAVILDGTLSPDVVESLAVLGLKVKEAACSTKEVIS